MNTQKLVITVDILPNEVTFGNRIESRESDQTFGGGTLSELDVNDEFDSSKGNENLKLCAETVTYKK